MVGGTAVVRGGVRAEAGLAKGGRMNVKTHATTERTPRAKDSRSGLDPASSFSLPLGALVPGLSLDEPSLLGLELWSSRKKRLAPDTGALNC